MLLRKWNLLTLVCGVAVAISAGAPVVEAAGRETLSVNDASRIGMIAAWQRQLSVPGGLDGLVDAELIVDLATKKQFVELLSDGKVLFRLSADQLGANGQPMGLEEAKRLAKLETYKLKRRGIESEISVREVPEVRLYALGADGTIECRDAEDGRILWVERYGNPNIESLPMAVNTELVTFVNADHLYVLDAKTGELVTEKVLEAVPLFGPALVGDYVMCICTRGRVTGYWLKDFDREPFVGSAVGLPMAEPVTDSSLGRTMWPTDRGYLYALEGNGKAGMAFRFKASGLVSSSVANSANGWFFAGSEKGQVYGLKAVGMGRVAWRQSLGGPVYGTPTVLGDNVFVRTAYGSVYCMDASTGVLQWNAPVGRVERILGGNGKQLLVRLTSAHLASVDVDSGAVLVDLSATEISHSIRNPFTDRLYLVSQTGMIQCLRPINAELPKLLTTELETPSAGPAEPEAGAGEPAKPQNGSPFGFGNEQGNDPFGGGGAGGNDPFGGAGGGNDPFGGAGGGDAGDDPFDFGGF